MKQKRNWRDVSEEQHLEAHAELAKLGISLNIHKSDEPTRTELLQDRAALRRGINALIEEGKKAVNDRAKYDHISANIDTLGTWIDGVVEKLDLLDIADSAMRDRTAGASGWRTPEGKEVPVLSKDQKFTDLGGVKPQNGNGIGFGEAIRAMAIGTRDAEIRNALSEGTDQAGGYTVPVELLRQLIDKMRARTTVIRAGAVTIPLETQKTSIARIASDPSAAWRLENAAIAESDPTFELVQFNARSLAVLVKVSREVLEDSLNLEQALMNAFAGSMAVELDRVALFGTGTAPEPRGVYNTPGVGSVSMGANGLALSSYDPLIDVLQTLADANAADPTAAILAPRTASALAKLKDTTGQPLRKPDALANLPFLSSTVVPTNQTEGTSTNASCIISGDFTQLMIGIRTQLRIELLRELYAANHQYAFVAHLRADVQLAQPPALAKLSGIIP